MSPVVMKEKAKAEKRKKPEEKEKENGGKEEVVVPPTKQVKQDPKPKPVEKPEPPKKVDVYKEIVELELRESRERDIQEDDNLFKHICSELRDLLKDLYTLKMTKGEKPKADIKEKRIQASLLFVKMKKLNRLEKLRIRTAREKTSAAKQTVDEFNLQLQNLRYEVLHLKKEVSRCINFWSADEGVKMVEVPEFYAQAPPEISKPEITKDDPHQQRLARLAWELKTRKDLDLQAQELEEVKNQKESVVGSKEDKIKDLGRYLQNILKATRPVQESLELPLDKERAQKSLAAYLPDPLYILYSQADAYCRGLDPLLSVEIVGDQDQATNFREDKEEQDEDEVEKEGTGRGDKTSVRGTAEKVEEKKHKLLRAHPLAVVLHIKTKDGDEVSVTFSYLVQLGIVAAQGRLHLTDQTFAGEVVEVGSVLGQLYEGDEGQHSPNLKNEYQLKEAGLSGDVCKLIRDSGCPYVWAQRLAGLNFLSSAGVDKSISFLHMQKTVNTIRKRLSSRVSLQRQLNLLDQGKGFRLDSVPQNIVDKFPIKVCSRLKSWGSLTWEKFSQHEETSSVCSNGVVDSSDFLYKGVLNRGVANLTALVSLKPDYPASSPVFSLSLQWRDKWTALNNEWIRDLEKEMNVHVEEEEKDDNLLIHQVYKLLVLLDVLLESVSALDEEPLFTRDKEYQNPVEGRQRKLPFVFSIQEKIFAQR